MPRSPEDAARGQIYVQVPGPPGDKRLLGVVELTNSSVKSQSPFVLLIKGDVEADLHLFREEVVVDVEMGKDFEYKIRGVVGEAVGEVVVSTPIASIESFGDVDIDVRKSGSRDIEVTIRGVAVREGVDLVTFTAGEDEQTVRVVCQDPSTVRTLPAAPRIVDGETFFLVFRKSGLSSEDVAVFSDAACKQTVNANYKRLGGSTVKVELVEPPACIWVRVKDAGWLRKVTFENQ